MPFDDESLPRDNGELVFDAPWQARALAIAVAVVERLGLPWDAFRHRLMASIAEDPQRPYYESWSKALESMVVDLDLATAAALDAATPINVRLIHLRGDTWVSTAGGKHRRAGSP